VTNSGVTELEEIAATMMTAAAVEDPGDELREVWQRSLGALGDLPSQNLAFIRLSRLDAVVNETALLAVPNEFAKDIIESRLRSVITAVLAEQLGQDIRLAVVVDPSLDTSTDADNESSRALGDGADHGRQPSTSRPLADGDGPQDDVPQPDDRHEETGTTA